jgi:hypothetical protein
MNGMHSQAMTSGCFLRPTICQTIDTASIWSSLTLACQPPCPP